MRRETRRRLTALTLGAAAVLSLGSAAVLAEEDAWLPPVAVPAETEAREEEADMLPPALPEDTEPAAPEAVPETVPDPETPPEEAVEVPAAPPETTADTGNTADAGNAPDAGTATDTAGAPDADAWLPPEAGNPPAAPGAVDADAPEEEEDLSYLAGPDDGGAVPEERVDLPEQQTRNQEKLERLLEQVTSEAGELESVAFGSVENLARTRNLTVLGLEENIAGLEGLDYDKMQDTMRDSLNAIARGQDAMMTQISYLGGTEPLGAVAVSSAVTSMQTTYNSLYDQFKAIRDGDLQKNNLDLIRQLRNAEDQLVMGGESLYIALVSMEAQEDALERQLTALNRTVAEMELRYSLGQISALTLGEVTTGRSSLVSGMETLKMNLKTYKMQLQTLLGASPTGTLRLGGLPAVTEKQLNAMDVERDLSAAMEKSYELYSAAVTLDNARTSYENQSKQYKYNEKNAMYQQGLHTWTAAQNTYNNALRSYELRFRTLYEKVLDDYQILGNAKLSLKQQEASYGASELKYEQGTISQNALYTARDDLDTAKEAVTSAENTLFSDYNNYCWAVEHGILN